MNQPNHIHGKQARSKDVQLTSIQSSLLPPSDEMERYERFYPGATEKLFDYIGHEQANRHKLERCRNWNIIRGQIFALIALSSLVLLAAYSFYLKMAWAGGVVAAFSIVGIVGAFLRVKEERK